MSAGSRPWLAHRVWILLLCLLCGYGPGATPAGRPQAGAVAVLLPPNRTVLPSGDFDLICRTEQATFRVDGKTHAWECFEPPVRVSRLKLAPGLHELGIGTEQRKVFIATRESPHAVPKEWSVHRAHPIEDTGKLRCAACHETAQLGGRIVVGEPKTYTACFQCHRSVDFDVTHSHPLQPIEACQMCHALHGSNRQALLKAPIKQLCGRCHEA